MSRCSGRLLVRPILPDLLKVEVSVSRHRVERRWVGPASASGSDLAQGLGWVLLCAGLAWHAAVECHRLSHLATRVPSL